MKTLKAQLTEIITKLPGVSGGVVVEYPNQSVHGDYSTNIAMVTAKRNKKNPMDMANEFVELLKKDSFVVDTFGKVEAVKPGFINFYLKREALQDIFKMIVESGDAFGRSDIGFGKKVVIDYSSPNIAKQMHVGHLRSTIIGQALYNIYSYLGYEVVGDNHLGDWGTKFGALIAMYRDRFGDSIREDLSIDEMERMYVEFTAMSKTDDSLKERARVELKNLQDGKEFNVRLWKLFRQRSIDEIARKIYSRLGIEFDYMYGEAFYYDLPAVREIYGEESSIYADGIVKDAVDKGIAKRSEGALIIDLDSFDLPPMLIEKSDGGQLYSTSDLATIHFRQSKFNPDVVLYVVGSEQSMHFKQLFASAKLLGYIDKNNESWAHVPFGLVLGDDGKKVSTREGGIVYAHQFIEKSLEIAYSIVNDKHPEWDEETKREVARIVGMGALKYNDLSRDRSSNITFNWDSMMSFGGASAPYLQYTYARIQSIFSKISSDFSGEPDYSLLEEDKEIELVSVLQKFPEVLESVIEQNKPNILTNYLETLASAFHGFYESVHVLVDNEKLQYMRLHLIKAVGSSMKNGLGLLGIEVSDKI